MDRSQRSDTHMSQDHGIPPTRSLDNMTSFANLGRSVLNLNNIPAQTSFTELPLAYVK